MFWIRIANSYCKVCTGLYKCEFGGIQFTTRNLCCSDVETLDFKLYRNCATQKFEIPEFKEFPARLKVSSVWGKSFICSAVSSIIWLSRIDSR